MMTSLANRPTRRRSVPSRQSSSSTAPIGSELVGSLRIGLIACLVGAIGASGCKQTETVPEAGPDYARQLGPGESALRRLGPEDPLPDLGAAWRDRDPFLLAAIDHSLRWFQAPSSRQFFPFEDITTHEQAEASLIAFRHVLLNTDDVMQFERELLRLFDVYQSVGWDNRGTVLYTGYYSPEFRASRLQTPEFTAPLYHRPADLVTEPITGRPLGRRQPDGSIAPYPTRGEIESSRLLEGTELVWLENDFDAYIVHVNGSAKLRLPDDSVMFIGYAGKTDRPYVGVGKSMLDEGLIDPNRLSLAAIRDFYRRDPATVRRLIERNESYVFFREYDGGNWPSGSLGVPVTERTSLATDKRIYPRGGLVVAQTTSTTFSGGKAAFNRFMLDQDTGGAIQAPGRADIYMGVGPAAEILAGGQYNEGTLYYLILRPEYVHEFRPSRRTANATPASASARSDGRTR